MLHATLPPHEQLRRGIKGRTAENDRTAPGKRSPPWGTSSGKARGSSGNLVARKPWKAQLRPHPPASMTCPNYPSSE
jgi:hypothetical protein